MKVNVVIEPGEDGWFVAHLPAFRGCWSQGRSREETLTNIREAAELWLESQNELNTANLAADAEKYSLVLG